MSTPHPLASVTQLIRDTFRQARASGIFWMMLAVTGVCALLCLSVNISGDAVLEAVDEPGFFLPTPSAGNLVPAVVLIFGGQEPFQATALAAASQKILGSLEANPAAARREGIETVCGKIGLAFGAISIPVGRDRVAAVRFLELLLAGGGAGTFGLLLTLVWTAGFVPAFLEPSSVLVLLAKPVGRWQLLFGKVFGVCAFVGFQTAIFVAATWLALGVRTGVWDVGYWWCLPLLLLEFLVFYSFSVLLAVITRSTVACVFGSVLFWLLAWGINYASLVAHSASAAAALPNGAVAFTDAGYWISPKPIDGGLILFNAIQAQDHFEKPEVFRMLESAGNFSPLRSILSSLLLAGVLLALAAHEFNATDY